MSVCAFQVQRYKNVHGVIAKKADEKYNDLKFPSALRDERLMSINQHKILVACHSNSGGVLQLLDLAKDLGRRCENAYKFTAHTSQITDFSFSPFDSNVFVTVSSQGLLKLWKVDEEKNDGVMVKEIKTLRHGRKAINVVKWNPTAQGVLASGGDDGLKVWDVDRDNESKLSWDVGVNSLGWNFNGSLLAAGTRDGRLLVLNPREKTVVLDIVPHGSPLPPEVFWVADQNWVCSIGKGKYRNNQLVLFDAISGEKLTELNLDSSSASLRATYDYGSSILLLYSRGDVILKMFEFISEKPYIRGLNPVNTLTPFKSIEIYPRQLLDFENTEVLRLMKVTQSEIVPIALKVPKGKSEWRDDLYPDVPGFTPALSAADWFNGKTSNPILQSLKPQVQTIEKEDETNDDEDDDEWYTPVGMKLTRTTHYRHIFGDVAGSSTFYTDLRPANNAVMKNTIKANKSFFAIGLEGIGGKVGIYSLKTTGRLNKPIPAIETGCELHDFDFHPFNDNIFVTGGDNGLVQVWGIPPDGMETLKSNLTNPNIVLQGHGGKISTVDFHPVADNVLCSSSSDNSLIFWDITSENPKIKLDAQDTIFNTTFNPAGNIVAVCNKSNSILLFDVRAKESAGSAEAVGGMKGSRIEWVGDKNQIFCVGFSKDNERKYKVLDIRNLSTELKSERIDYGIGTFYTHYQEGMNVISLWGKGDSSLKFFELVDDASCCHFLTDYTTLTMQVGIAFLPLSVCNIKEVEFARILKLTNEKTVQPHSLYVPRTRKDYFQDDIFPPNLIRAEEPSQTAEQFFNGEVIEPKRADLNPGLPLFSTAPKIVRRMRKYKEVAEEDPSQVEENTLSSVYNKMMEKKDAEEEVLKHELNEGVDSDEWSD